MIPHADERPLRVGLVDDHEIVWLAFGQLVSGTPGMQFVGAARSVDGLLGDPQRVEARAVDVVVVDVDLRDGGGPLDNALRIRAGGAAVLGWTSGHHPYRERELLATGACVLHRSEPAAILLAAIADVARGLTPITTVPVALAGHDEARLSPQEAKVLALFAGGSKLRVVAYETGLAYSTVEDYVRRIRAKYHRVGRPALTKTDLLLRAIEDGYLPLPLRESPPRLDGGPFSPA